MGFVHDQDLMCLVFHEVGGVKTPRRLKQRLAVFAVFVVSLGEVLGERVAKRLIGGDQKPESL